MIQVLVLSAGIVTVLMGITALARDEQLSRTKKLRGGFARFLGASMILFGFASCIGVPYGTA